MFVDTRASPHERARMRWFLGFLLFAACNKSASTSSSGLALGEATVYENVDRKWQHLDPPRVEMKLHADGNVEFINDKTGEPWIQFEVKPDGSLGHAGKMLGRLGDNKNVTIDGNTATVTIENEHVKVTLGDDGNVTVHDRPDGVKWRIEAKDPAVRYTAFRVLAISMKTALD
jgi:hypothetical protein